ncbi:hypothetical protein M5C72_04605 [Companilactobacillus allii]|uniref:MFS transporter n=1 Tax=Companilactobacillus allii TaxID=1847728 RepID=A0A1P8Q3H2_9LACO|nr:hypothetical protein [Companilactobacillus allii]APX72414.1 hypothetical protein BTM29_07545 [Companilactobacillus allii]USQ69508.1 hypothetical protein M5C72_04605 [Companilactobacillus allii]
MKKIFETFSEGVLNLFANVGVVIPYFFCLSLYNHNKDIAVYVLPFLMLYTFRSIGMLLTVYIPFSASTMLIVSNLFGIVGSLMIVGSLNPVLGILGGILLGLASSWIWPYFLTVRTKGKIINDFHITKLHWQGSIIAMMILGLVELLSIKFSTYNVAFILLAVFFLISLIGSYTMKNKISFYHNGGLPKHDRNYSIIGIIFIIILVMLVFAIRYSRLKTISHGWDLIIGLVALVGLIVLLLYQLKIHRNLYPLSLASINRGIVMNFILLYTIFDSSLRFGFSTLLTVYIIYLVGFEFGPFILKKHLNMRYPLLILGLILSIFNITYFVGILLCSLFVGSDNSILNNSLYNDPKIESERAFLVKYQLSAVGNISQQLFYMIIVYIIGYMYNVDVLNFFNVNGNVNSKWLLIVRLAVTFGVLLSATATYLVTRNIKEAQS